MTMLSEDQVNEISSGYCPDCGHRGFVGGPNVAGINWHAECGNVDCRARFAVTWFSGGVTAGERIPKVSEGGPMWPNEPNPKKGKKRR